MFILPQPVTQEQKYERGFEVLVHVVDILLQNLFEFIIRICFLVDLVLVLFLALTWHGRSVLPDLPALIVHRRLSCHYRRVCNQIACYMLWRVFRKAMLSFCSMLRLDQTVSSPARLLKFRYSFVLLVHCHLQLIPSESTASFFSFLFDFGPFCQVCFCALSCFKWQPLIIGLFSATHYWSCLFVCPFSGVFSPQNWAPCHSSGTHCSLSGQNID